MSTKPADMPVANLAAHVGLHEAQQLERQKLRVVHVSRSVKHHMTRPATGSSSAE